MKRELGLERELQSTLASFLLKRAQPELDRLKIDLEPDREPKSGPNRMARMESESKSPLVLVSEKNWQRSVPSMLSMMSPNRPALVQVLGLLP